MTLRITIPRALGDRLGKIAASAPGSARMAAASTPPVGAGSTRPAAGWADRTRPSVERGGAAADASSKISSMYRWACAGSPEA